MRFRPAALICAALTVAACTQATPPPPPVTIGLLLGGGAGADQDSLRGAQLAVEIVNGTHPRLTVPFAAGSGLPGLGGASLSLADTIVTPEVHAGDAAVQLTAEENAVGVVLADTAAVAEIAAGALQRSQVPVVDAYSGADYLTELGMDWYFHLGPTDQDQADVAFELLRDRVAGSRPPVAVVVEAGPDAAVAGQLIDAAAARAGAEVTLHAQLPGEHADRTGAVPGAVVAWAATADGAARIVTSVTEEFDRAALIGLGPGFQNLDDPRPHGVDQAVLRVVPWSPDLARRSPAAAALTQLYRERFGAEMSYPAAATFTAVLTLAVAVDQGGGDRSATRAALRRFTLPATQLVLPWDGVRFESDGQNAFAHPVVERWWQGEFRVEYPAELRGGPPAPTPRPAS